MLKDKEGTSTHAKGTKEKHTSLQGVLIHSKRVQFLVTKECAQEENLSFLGAIF